MTPILCSTGPVFVSLKFFSLRYSSDRKNIYNYIFPKTRDFVCAIFSLETTHAALNCADWVATLSGGVSSQAFAGCVHPAIW